MNIKELMTYRRIRKIIHISLSFIMLVIIWKTSGLFNSDAPIYLEYSAKDSSIHKDDVIYFSKESGFYDDEFLLTMENRGGALYYTLDGNEPSPGDDGTFKYSGGIHISDATGNPNDISMRKDISGGFLIRNGVQNEPAYQSPKYNIDKATVVTVSRYK